MGTFTIWTGPNVDPVYGDLGADTQSFEVESESGEEALATAKQAFAPWNVIVVGPDKRRVPDDVKGK